MIPDVGEVFRRFRLVQKAGRGGMGTVFRAHDTRLDRDVALKFLTGMDPLAPGLAARFRSEAKSLATLNQPNIVTIFDADEHDGELFLVLEWAAGGSLADPAHAGPMHLQRFGEVALAVAEALGAAHERGIVHRDAKPGNVLLFDDGRAKLADFGLAKLRDSTLELTGPGTIAGTIAYMAPEQATGAEVGPATDVFAFGVMAYELLTGTRPFPGDNPAAVLHSLLHSSAAALQPQRDDVTSELAATIERCLAKMPADRFRSGVELADSIQAAITPPPTAPAADLGATIEARPDAGPDLRQDIRFCRTADGVDIAYSVVGSGPVLVRVLGWFTHLELEWEWPEMRALWEGLAEHHTVIRYDGRGIGLSSAYQGEFTEETRRLDLEAVLDVVGAESVALLGISEGGWTAALYAVDHPDRVSHLVLYGAYRRGGQARPSFDADQRRAMLTLVRTGWGKDTPTFRQLFTSLFLPGDVDFRVLAHFDEIQRRSADPETAARYLKSCEMRGDGRDFFTQVSVPTLVVHGRHEQVIGFEEGRLLAAAIPDAKLLPLSNGMHYFPSSCEVAAEVAEAISQHLGTQGD